MPLSADDIREGQNYRMKDGKVWRVVDFADFNGHSCVQLMSTTGKAVLYWKFMSIFLAELADEN